MIFDRSPFQGRTLHDADIRVNIYGAIPNRLGAPPDDNIGLQYGPAALNSGAISVDEFPRVNEKVGGTDMDGKVVAERTHGGSDRAEEHLPERPQGFIQRGAWQRPILMSRMYTDHRGDFTIASATSWCARGCSGPTPLGQFGDLDWDACRCDRRRLDTMNAWLMR